MSPLPKPTRTLESYGVNVLAELIRWLVPMFTEQLAAAVSDRLDEIERRREIDRLMEEEKQLFALKSRLDLRSPEDLRKWRKLTRKWETVSNRLDELLGVKAKA